MIDLFLSLDMELKVLLLFGIVMLLLEFIKQFILKVTRQKDNNAKKGHNK